MAEENQTAEGSAADIVFDCPHCGKSLEIDARGAGMMITCPDCNNEVQVPVLEGGVVEEESPPPALTPEEAQAEIERLGGAVAAAQKKIERLVESLEEVRNRRTYLEKLRSENIARFDRVGGELTVIQSALDRIVSLLADAKSEKTEDV